MANLKIHNQFFNANYKGLLIKSDVRVHLKIFEILQNRLKQNKKYDLLDIASGQGALSQRVIDNFPNINVDTNDIVNNKSIKGVRTFFSKDLNNEFNFERKYDVIMAVEIIEHLENPWHFMRNLKNHLKFGGFVILSTPSQNSFFDRLWFLYYGYNYYFGDRGIISSGGHITMCPVWLLKHIANRERMLCVNVVNDISFKSLLGWRARLLYFFITPLKWFLRDIHDESNTIFLLSNMRNR